MWFSDFKMALLFLLKFISKRHFYDTFTSNANINIHVLKYRKISMPLECCTAANQLVTWFKVDLSAPFIHDCQHVNSIMIFISSVGKYKITVTLKINFKFAFFDSSFYAFQDCIIIINQILP